MTYKITHLHHRAYQVIIEGKTTAYQIADYLDESQNIYVQEVRVGWRIKQITIILTYCTNDDPETIINQISSLLDKFIQI
jgi:hypothetical protein